MLRFKEIDGANQGALVSLQLFTVVIPLMILGFSYFTGFAANASPGTVWIRELGLSGSTSDTVRGAFGDTAALRSVWTVVGVAAFLVWGIPMAILVASIFAKAWQREQFGVGQRLLRGALWFLLYLTMLVLRERIAFGAGYTGATQALMFAVALIPVWLFWSLTPLILVRDGGHGLKYLALAGLAGVVIDGINHPDRRPDHFSARDRRLGELRADRRRHGDHDVVRRTGHRVGHHPRSSVLPIVNRCSPIAHRCDGPALIDSCLNQTVCTTRGGN